MSDLKSRLAKLSPEQIAKLNAAMGKNKFSVSPDRFKVLFRRPKDAIVPMSDAQRRMWFMYHLGGAGEAYNMVGAFEVRGNLNVAALQSSFELMVSRHEILRTSFHQDDQTLYQKVHDQHTATVSLENYSIESDDQWLETLRDRWQHLSRHTFTLENPGPFEVVLLKRSDQHFVLMMNFHHIISDAWSMNLMTNELVQLYIDKIGLHKFNAKPIEFQYADYAYAQQSEANNAKLSLGLNYWKQQLEGMKELALSYDFPAPIKPSYTGKTCKFSVKPGVAQALDSFCRENNKTPFMVLLAALNILLRQQTGTQDIVIGTTIANRSHSDLEDVLGFFANTLALRVKQPKELSFIDLVEICRTTILDAHSHQSVPFEQVVGTVQAERSLTHTPLFRVALVLDNTPQLALNIPGLSISSMDMDIDITKFDLTFYTQVDRDDIQVGIQYSDQLFKASTIKKLFDQLENILQCGVATPDIGVDDIAHERCLSVVQREFWADKLDGASAPWWAGYERLNVKSIDIHLPENILAALRALAGEDTGAWSRWCLVCHGVFVALLNGNKDVLTSIISDGSEAFPLRIQYHGRSLADIEKEIEQLIRLIVNEHSFTLLDVAAHDHMDTTGSACVFEGFGFELPSGTPTLKPLTHALRSLFSLNKDHSRLSLRLFIDSGILLMVPQADIKEYFERVFESWINAPRAAINNRAILGEHHVAKLLHMNQAVSKVYGADKCLHELFEEKVALNPNAVALIFEDQQLTYAQLNEQSNKIARLLVADYEVRPDSLVGICVDRSLSTIINILAVLKAGGAYVPLDPSYPEARLHYILEDSKPSCVLTHSSCIEKLAGFEAVVALDSESLLTRLNALSGGNLSSLISTVSCNNIAYVIYTSGSTGNPKGVVVEHRQVTRLMAASQDDIHFSENDIWTLFHSYAFDFSVFEMWGALLFGGRLVVVPYWVSRSPKDFYQLLIEQQVTVLSQTPSAFNNLAYEDQEQGAKLALSYVVFGGEALSFSSLVPWVERHGDKPRLVNMYGITETTVHVTFKTLSASDIQMATGASIVGRPLRDLEVVILDASGELVPTGVIGEMYVGGAGVTRGYLNRPELTKSRFVTLSGLSDRFPGLSENIFYRSGDLARYLPNGELEYLGRIDHQVKIRGFRIELGEIEHALAEIVGVKDVLVMAKTADDNSGYLVAYVVVKKGAEGKGRQVENLQKCLAEKLPAHMMPSAFVILDKFPLTANGKIDRKGLPEPSWERSEEEAFIALEGPVESALADIWKQVLGVSTVSRSDNFFKLGGDSIKCISVVSKAKKLGLTLTIEAIFMTNSLGALAQSIEGQVVNHDEKMSDQPLPLKRFQLIPDSLRDMLPSGIVDAYPMSTLQEMMLMRGAEDKHKQMYHNTASTLIRGSLDVSTLRKALKTIVENHEILRTSFDTKNYGINLQLVHETIDLPLRVEDLSGLSKVAQQQRIEMIEAEEMANIFESGSVPLFRINILILDENRFQFAMTENHGIMDGWSVAQFFDELMTHYFAGGKSSTREKLPLQYRDYIACEQAAIANDAHSDFWRKELDGYHTTELTPWQNVPCEGGRGFEVTETLSSSLVDKLSNMALEFQVPLKTLLLSTHVAVLSKLTGQKKVLTGASTHGRPVREDSEKMIGLFVCMLPVTCEIEYDNWQSLCQKLHDKEIATLNHRAFPLGAIQQSLNRRNLLDNCYNFIHFPEQNEKTLGEFRKQGGKQHQRNSFRFSVTFNLIDSDDGEVTMSLEFDPEQYSDQQIDYIKGQYYAALESLTCDTSASGSLTQFLRSPEREYYSRSFDGVSAPWWVSNISGRAREVEIPIDQTTFEHIQGLQKVCGVSLQSVCLASHMMFLRLISGNPNVLSLVSNGDDRAFPVSAKVHGESVQGLVTNLERDLGLMQTCNVFELLEQIRREDINLSGAFFRLTSDGTHTAKSIRDSSGGYGISSVFFLNSSTLRLCVRMDEAILSSISVEQLQGYWRNIFGLIGDGPTLCVDNTRLIGPDNFYSLLYQYNNTATRFTSELCIQELFEYQVIAQGDAVALEFEQQTLSYRALNKKANQLAQYLVEEHGVVADTPVGICLDRSLDMVVAIWAILKAGGAYVPLDPDYPQSRLRYMFEDAQLGTVITAKNCMEFLPGTEAKVLCMDDEALKQVLEGYCSDNIKTKDIGLNSRNLAYIIYTSGSTGNPKGVMVEHQALVNRVEWMIRQYRFGPGDRILQKTPFSFDVSVWEFVCPLIVGAQLVLAKPGGHKDPQYLTELIQQIKITQIHFVPSMLSSMLAYGGLSQCGSLKQVFCSGEALHISHVKKFLTMRPNTELHNLYGPTEAAIDVSYWDCGQVSESDTSIPIGKPIQNIQLHVLDANLQLVPDGVPGELHIGGIGLARGYYKRDQLTAEKFIVNPFFDENVVDSSQRLYRTGDLVRRMLDGNIDYLGRMDNQVKIRGFRVELGEIESALLEHSDLSDAVVLIKADAKNENKIIAYVTTKDIFGFNLTELADDELILKIREKLSLQLPRHMIPHQIFVVDKIPLTPNGKVDRASLLQMKNESITALYVPPSTKEEKLTVELWSSILGIDPEKISLTDNFFSLGGDSLVAVKLISIVNKKAGLDLSLSLVFERQTVQDFSKFIATEIKKNKKNVFGD